MSLRYLYAGPKPHKRGRPQKYAGKVNLKNLDMSVFRDAKQFTGLTHCQARNKEALSFAFNASLTSVNVARAFARQQGMDLSVGSTKTLQHNAAMVDRFIAMSGKSRTCDLMTLISKNFYSTALKPWRNFYKFNELLLICDKNNKIVGQSMIGTTMSSFDQEFRKAKRICR